MSTPEHFGVDGVDLTYSLSPLKPGRLIIKILLLVYRHGGEALGPADHHDVHARCIQAMLH